MTRSSIRSPAWSVVCGSRSTGSNSSPAPFAFGEHACRDSSSSGSHITKADTNPARPATTCAAVCFLAATEQEQCVTGFQGAKKKNTHKATACLRLHIIRERSMDRPTRPQRIHDGLVLNLFLVHGQRKGETCVACGWARVHPTQWTTRECHATASGY